jgi:ABC-type antimicrobial peptide transport system permease subunit
LLGLTLHRAGTVTVSDLFDLPVPFTFRPSLLLTAAAVSLAIVVVGSVVPAVIAARTPVAGAS